MDKEYSVATNLINCAKLKLKSNWRNGRAIDWSMGWDDISLPIVIQAGITENGGKTIVSNEVEIHADVVDKKYLVVQKPQYLLYAPPGNQPADPLHRSFLDANKAIDFALDLVAPPSCKDRKLNLVLDHAIFNHYEDPWDYNNAGILHAFLEGSDYPLFYFPLNKPEAYALFHYEAKEYQNTYLWRMAFDWTKASKIANLEPVCTDPKLACCESPIGLEWDLSNGKQTASLHKMEEKEQRDLAKEFLEILKPENLTLSERDLSVQFLKYSPKLKGILQTRTWLGAKEQDLSLDREEFETFSKVWELTYPNGKKIYLEPYVGPEFLGDAKNISEFSDPNLRVDWAEIPGSDEIRETVIAHNAALIRDSFYIQKTKAILGE